MHKLASISLSIALVVLCLSGCATKGRFRLVNIDTRTPEQIAAYYREAELPYSTDVVTSAPEVQAKALPTWWGILVSAVTEMKCRISVIDVEWGPRTN